MSRSLAAALVLFAALSVVHAAAAAPLPRLTNRPAATPGELVVVLPAGESFASGARGEALVPDTRIAALLAREGLEPARVLGRGGTRAAGASRASALAGRFALLRSHRPDFDPIAASEALRASGRFAAVCPNYGMRLFDTLPNDPYVPNQWSIQDVGGSDIRLPAAWDVTTGSTSVVIAILDTGVDTGHPDLAGQIWQNAGEVPGNFVDDDLNGYADDTQGWDFGDGDADPNPGPMIDEIGLDVGFHGTFCAGIAGAGTDNATGIAGAGWLCRIMPLRVFDSAGVASNAAITDAIGYAIDNGARVISMSFGAPDQPGLPEFFQALIDVANAAGVVCVAAAGNDGVDTPITYPAGCAHVISVGATTDTNERAGFSNWGPWVDVAAPGSLMWSTLCRNYEIDEISQIFYIYFFGWDGENPYMYGDGTSFACPLVAGVVGLLLSEMPGLTPDQVEAHLKATGNVVAYDHPIGPRVNAFNAVSTGVTAVSSTQAVAGFA
ncbi:MAG: S8 family serine peptidase, partial [Candidatus Eisenbacteria bacterium]